MSDFQQAFDNPPAVGGVWSKKWDYRAETTGVADVQPMWIADMDFETPQAVKDAVIRRAELGIYGYTAVDREYHEAVINWQRTRHNWEIQEEWILHTPSVICGIQTAVRALTDRNDYVLVQPPAYHPFFRLLHQTHRRVLESPLLDRGDHYEVDWADFEAKLRDYRPRLFILCNPHNPVGKVYTPEELRRFGTLCRQYGAIVISDEIHGDLTLPGTRHTPFGTLGEEFAQNAVICTAASKTFNLAGLHLSNIIVPNADLRGRMRDALTEAGFPAPNLFALVAGNAAFREGAAGSTRCGIIWRATARLRSPTSRSTSARCAPTAPRGRISCGSTAGRSGWTTQGSSSSCCATPASGPIRGTSSANRARALSASTSRCRAHSSKARWNASRRR